MPRNLELASGFLEVKRAVHSAWTPFGLGYRASSPRVGASQQTPGLRKRQASGAPVARKTRGHPLRPAKRPRRLRRTRSPWPCARRTLGLGQMQLACVDEKFAFLTIFGSHVDKRSKQNHQILTSATATKKMAGRCILREARVSTAHGLEPFGLWDLGARDGKSSRCSCGTDRK